VNPVPKLEEETTNRVVSLALGFQQISYPFAFESVILLDLET
jgi:hypothetical protein